MKKTTIRLVYKLSNTSISGYSEKSPSCTKLLIYINYNQYNNFIIYVGKKLFHKKIIGNKRFVKYVSQVLDLQKEGITL